MKSKGIKELHTKTMAELKTTLNEARIELFNFKLEKVQNKLKNLRSLFHLKKDIARIQTILKEKEFEAAQKVAK